MKLDQLMSYYEGKNVIKKFYKNCDLKTNSRSFCVDRELSKIQRLISTGIKFLKRATYIRYVNSTTIKICSNQFAGFLRFLFTEDFW